MTVRTGIRVAHLTVSHGRVPALRDVSLTALPGLVTGLIGPNGAGKSTLVRAVLGMAAPDAGTITIDGAPPRVARRRVAYLPQRSDTEADYPVQIRELVAMGRLPHTGPLRPRSAEDRRRIDAAIARVGLEGLEGRPLGRTSGGQQQRAHFARALAQDADTFVLDEPFSGIDAPTIRLLSEVVREVATAGASVLIVVHDLASLEALCDRVVLINRSTLADGTPREVLTSPALAHAYGTASSPAMRSWR